MKNISLILLFTWCSHNFAFSQITICGTIKESCKKEELSGASIRVKNKKTKTTSDLNGHYCIRCKKSSDTLIFSFLGYKTQIQRIGKQKTIDIILQEDTVQIKEIPVVGYGVQCKSDMTGKPVIYLYPQKATDITLQIQYNGELKTTYPLYNKGWNVRALPTGEITNTADGKEYSYLFWDGLKQYTKQELSYNSGFFVAGDSALQFLQHILPQTGLLPKEYNEFIVYWLPLMQANKLNFVHFRLQDDYSVISTNTVSPKPDVEIRVFMEFKAVDKVTAIKPQKINTPTRRGFTLVEWGGSEIKDEIQINETIIGFKQ